MEETVKVIEAINTFQGEGVNSGRRCLLLRFKYCSRKIPCYFCDTQVKLRILEEMDISLDRIQNIIDKSKVGLLITGGCPTFGAHFEDTKILLNELSYPFVCVESNGYKLLELIQEIDKTKKVYYTYSPKIFSDEELKLEKEKTKKLVKYNSVYFKIVFENKPFNNNYAKFLSGMNINDRVYLMPQGQTRKELIKNSGIVFDACEKYKFNFSTRDHIIFNFI